MAADNTKESLGETNDKRASLSSKSLPAYSQRIKRYRGIKGWSQSVLAKEIDTDQKTVSRWETGESKPDYTNQQALMKAFEKNAEELGFVDKGPEEKSADPPLNAEGTENLSLPSSASEGLSPTSLSSSSIAMENDLTSTSVYSRLQMSKKFRKRKFLIVSIILLVVAASFLPFLPLSVCYFTFCFSPPSLNKQPSSQNAGEIHDQNLSVEVVDVVSPSFVLSGDPKQYSSHGINLPTNINAVLIAQNSSIYDSIIINVQNLRYGGSDILIDYISLKLLSVPILPHPLRVWTPGAPKTYSGYSYPIMYRGQQPDQLLYAAPLRNVLLAPAGPNRVGESDPLVLQIRSTVTAFIQFQVEIAYQMAGKPQILTLPQIFQVVFSDASDWHEFVIQNGSLVADP